MIELMHDLNRGVPSKTTERALENGKKLVERIQSTLNDPNANPIIEV